MIAVQAKIEQVRQSLHEDLQRIDREGIAAASSDDMLLICAQNGIKCSADAMRQNGLDGSLYAGMEVMSICKSNAIII